MTPGPTASQVDAAIRAVLGTWPGRVDAPAVEMFAGRWLGLRHVESLPPGTQEIRLAPGTVITPLARDQMRRRGITARVVSAGELARSGHVGAWGFVLETGTPLADVIRHAFVSDRETWLDLGDTALDAARWVGAGDHRGAVVVTPEASVATWRACQVPRVRAATVASPDAVLRACRRLGANLVVIEPAEQSIYSIKHLCATFRRAGARRPRRARVHQESPAMRIGEVIGRVTLARQHPALLPANLVIALPWTLEAITNPSSHRSESVIVFDELGAGPGALIGFSEGREAAFPFGKKRVPVDAYCACLIDRIDV